jgi:V/A-type H+/Na+-transporting ATPase subunit K
MEELLYRHFLETGVAWAVIGAAMAVMLGGIGSARGIRTAAMQGAGVMSEKPELFGKLLVLIALPGTQGFYGFICAFMIASSAGLMAGEVVITPTIGVALMFVGICTGGVLWRSAISQGEAAAASISLTAKRPEEGGRSILYPALVETYAVVALLTAILLINWIANLQTIAPVIKAAVETGAQ